MAAPAKNTEGSNVLGERSSRRSGIKGAQYALIGMAALGLILVAGLVIGLATMSRSGNGEDPPATEDAVAAMDVPPLIDEPVNAPADTGPSTTEQKQRIVASIASWRDIKKIVSLKDTVRIQVLDVWVSSSVTGATRDTVLRSTNPGVESGPAKDVSEEYTFVADTSPAAEDETTESPETEPDAPSVSPSRPRYVFVKMSITCNNPSEALRYSSWNGYGENPAETSAILADSSGNICRIVPYAKNSDPSRQRSAIIMPAQEITDLLVFEAPPGTIDYIRLVLPYAAIGVTNARSAHVAYQFSRDDINAAPRDKLAHQPGRPAGAGPDNGDNPDMDAIRRGIADSAQGSGPESQGNEIDIGQFENPPSVAPDDAGGGDDSSPFPATNSVGGESPPSGFDAEEVPPDIRELIRAEGGGAKGNEEVEPFDDDRIK
jgi:hypothetical protein